ncbi:MAG: hypothetical protein J0I25_08990, partial [Sphingomonadales bacterium]|nr:hypothetical protein [Sphingomonadales bacterium]
MTNFRIATVLARQLWDSRGRPTVEAEVRLEGGAIGRAIAPAGASRGAHEAVDLRDGGAAFGGMGVAKAVANVAAEIAPALTGMDARAQAAIDRTLVALDGTANKGRLGANALVAVSMAVLHAAAAAEGAPLWRYLAGDRKVRVPLPEIQIFGGGAHAGRRTDIQDFMVMAPRAGSFRRALEITDDVYRAAGRLMEALGPLSGVADEGGWWPNFSSNEQALDTLTKAIEQAGHRPGEDVFISLDIAANELGDATGYRLALDDRRMDGAAMAEEVIGWTRRYPILSIEDPASQDDFATMATVMRAVGDNVQVIGDDVLVTNGGYGGVHYALEHGVPIVVAGRTEDKAEVSARIAWSGVGIDLRSDRPKPRQVGRAVRALLADPRYRERAAAIGAAIRRSPGPAALHGIVEAALRDGGAEAHPEAELVAVCQRSEDQLNRVADHFGVRLPPGDLDYLGFLLGTRVAVDPVDAGPPPLDDEDLARVRAIVEKAAREYLVDLEG